MKLMISAAVLMMALAMNFSPSGHLQIQTEPMQSRSCQTDLTLGQVCQSIQGHCVCHQHNEH